MTGRPAFLARRTADYWNEFLIDESDAWVFDDYTILRTSPKRPGGHVFFICKPKDGGRQISLGRLLTGAKAGQFVDHINGNPYDNRRENLRVCSQSDNNRNRQIYSTSRMNFKGVRCLGKRFGARITYRGKTYRYSPFDTEAEAARAYDDAARRLHGEFACVNFPDESLGETRSAIRTESNQ